MTLLLNWRVWAALILAGFLAFTHLTVYRAGEKHVKAQWDEAVASANADARKLEQRRQDMATEAANLAAKREAGIRSAAALARADADGLRGDLNAANEYAKESRAAAERVAGLATDLLGRCTARYLGVAEAAQRSDSEARELRQGWPK